MPHGDESAQLQLWRGTHGGPAALMTTHPLPFALQRGRAYHVRVDVAGTQFVTSVDRQVVSTDSAPGSANGRIGFWAAAGDEFNVAHPRVFSDGGVLLFEDGFDGSPYLEPTRWEGAPQ